MLSSTCGQLASYPLALVRTKLQANGTWMLSFRWRCGAGAPSCLLNILCFFYCGTETAVVMARYFIIIIIIIHEFHGDTSLKQNFRAAVLQTHIWIILNGYHRTSASSTTYSFEVCKSLKEIYITLWLSRTCTLGRNWLRPQRGTACCPPWR